MQLKLKDNHSKFLEILGKAPDKTVRALSIRQPWAWLIVHGYKDVENRTWSTGYRGAILIHASLHLDLDEFYKHRIQVQREHGITIPNWNELDYGGIVGIGLLTDCISQSKSKWFGGPFGLQIEMATPVRFIRYQGKLGLFTTTISVEEAA